MVDRSKRKPAQPKARDQQQKEAASPAEKPKPDHARSATGEGNERATRDDFDPNVNQRPPR